MGAVSDRLDRQPHEASRTDGSATGIERIAERRGDVGERVVHAAQISACGRER